MKQGEFKEIMIMAKNEIAMPKSEGIKRELAINQCLLLQRGARKILSNKRELLYKRQIYLIKELEKC